MAGKLRLGPFGFQPSHLDVEGLPALEDWEGPLQFAFWCQRASPWWIGDLLNAGQQVFGEEFSQICNGAGISPDMLNRYQSVARRVPPENRRESLSWSAHAAVARLEIDQQKKLLLKAEQQGWTSEDLRKEARRMQSQQE